MNYLSSLKNIKNRKMNELREINKKLQEDYEGNSNRHMSMNR
jgi:hypothetical protein